MQSNVFLCLFKLLKEYLEYHARHSRKNLTFTLIMLTILKALARVVESVDTQDLKSCGGNPVPVQVWPRAPPYERCCNTL